MMRLGQAAETRCTETVTGVVHRASACLQLEHSSALLLSAFTYLSLLTRESLRCHDCIFKEGKLTILLQEWH